MPSNYEAYEATEEKVSSAFLKDSEGSNSSKIACGERIIQALYNRATTQEISASWADAGYSDNTG